MIINENKQYYSLITMWRDVNLKWSIEARKYSDDEEYPFWRLTFIDYLVFEADIDIIEEGTIEETIVNEVWWYW